MRRAAPVVLLDKDGTLLEDVPYNVDPRRMRLAPGVAAGLRLLAGSGCRIAVITNQPGVARGLFPLEALGPVRDRLGELMLRCGVTLEGFYFCPHHPGGSVAPFARGCDCRKPAPGLLLAACRELGCAPGDAWFVGDILDDVEAGRRAGCRTVLLDCGSETEWRPGPLRTPHHRAQDFLAAMRIVLADGGADAAVDRAEAVAR